MQVLALLQRVKSKPAGFLCRKARDALRQGMRAALAELGVNPYRAASLSAGPADTKRWALRLGRLDRSLLLPPSQAPQVAGGIADLQLADEHPPFGPNLIGRNKISFLGGPEIDLGRVDWNLDYRSGLSWPPRWHLRIDYMDLARPSDVKVPWELSRLQFLAALGRRYLHTADESLAVRFAEIVRDWDRRNPVGWCVGWACATNCALRAISLIWARSFFARSRSLDPAFWRQVLRMLVEHGRFLHRNLEYSDINANHYTTNLVALLYLAVAVPWYRDSPRWRRLALGELDREIRLQTYPDGVLQEGSIAYHRLVLELFLHAGLLCRRNRIALSSGYWERLERMFEFAAAYLKPNGQAPLFGDNDNAKVQYLGDQALGDHRYLSAVGAVLFGREDMKAAAGRWWEEAFWLTGPAGWETWQGLGRGRRPASAAFPHGGFWFLRSGQTYAAIDCGDAGLRGRGFHGHNDTLSVEVSLAGRDLIVDKGCYTYTSSQADRVACLSAEGHNAVILDHQEPAEILLWKIPTVRTTPYRALDWRLGQTGGRFSGEHRGYLRAHGVRTVRTVLVETPHEVIIEDRVAGRGEHHLRWRWHYAPGLDAHPIRPGSARSEVQAADGRRFALSWQGPGLSGQLQPATYHPAYGLAVPIRCLDLSGRVRLPYEARFILRAVDARTAPSS